MRHRRQHTDEAPVDLAPWLSDEGAVDQLRAVADHDAEPSRRPWTRSSFGRPKRTRKRFVRRSAPARGVDDLRDGRSENCARHEEPVAKT
jgi:hypothetical protein